LKHEVSNLNREDRAKPPARRGCRAYASESDNHKSSTFNLQSSIPAWPDIGIVIKKVVPFPGRLETFILPPIASTVLWAIAKPKPVPVDLVVK
jgi:hypothetical protein